MGTKKMGFIVYISVLASIGLAGVAFAASDVFDRNLYFGLRSDHDVVRLQEFLTQEGVYNGPTNGNFYALTRDGVKKYQKTNDIEPAVGYFGPITRVSVNNKLAKSNIDNKLGTDKFAQIRLLQSQIDSLLKQLAVLQSTATIATTTTSVLSIQEPATTTPVALESVATTTLETATTTLVLPSSFDSTLRITSTYSDYTMTRFSAVVLGELVFSADEKIAITRLRFKNIGTLEDDNIHGLRLIDAKTNRILSTAILENSTAIFSMTPDATKLDQNLVVSGGTYTLLADSVSASTYGIRKTVEYDIESESDISAFAYDDLSRVAKLKQVVFPVKGPYIKTY